MTKRCLISFKPRVTHAELKIFRTQRFRFTVYAFSITVQKMYWSRSASYYNPTLIYKSLHYIKLIQYARVVRNSYNKAYRCTPMMIQNSLLAIKERFLGSIHGPLHRLIKTLPRLFLITHFVKDYISVI